MSMSTQPPEKQSGGMTAPALRFRTSMTLWGPLQLTLTNHLAGAELGYEAGRAAYYQEGSDEILERRNAAFSHSAPVPTARLHSQGHRRVASHVSPWLDKRAP